MSVSKNIGIGVLLLILVIHGIVSTSLEAEQASETAKLKFYRLSTDVWSNKQMGFQTVVVNHANTYCAQTPSSCGLGYWDAARIFNESSIGVMAVAVGKDLQVTVYIVFPTGANVSSVSQTQFLLYRVATKQILQNIRLDIEQAVGAYVTYIDSDYYGIPPDSLANSVIIPIAFVVLIGVIAVAIGLHCWNKHRNKKKRGHKDKEINSSKITPVKMGETGKHSIIIDTHHNLKRSNVADTDYPVPTTAPDYLNEFKDVDETQRNNALPPLPTEENNEETKERKRKRRKDKKKKRHRDSEDNSGDVNHSDTEKVKRRSSKSTEHANNAFEEDSDLA